MNCRLLTEDTKKDLNVGTLLLQYPLTGPPVKNLPVDVNSNRSEIYRILELDMSSKGKFLVLEHYGRLDSDNGDETTIYRHKLQMIESKHWWLIDDYPELSAEQSN